MDELTARQKKIFDFIVERTDRQGFPPTVREIGRRFRISSPKGVADHLSAIERKGYIKRSRRSSRGIEILFKTSRALPLAGRIAAGKPIEAVEESETIDLAGMFRYKDCYILQVKGVSMIEDCIADGDYVIVERRETANDGEIVVALIDGSEATLKRFYHEKNGVRLEPANAKMKPIQVKDVKIQGVVLGVLRKYE